MRTRPAATGREDAGPSSWFLPLSGIGLLIALALSWNAILQAEGERASVLLSEKTWVEISRFAGELLGVDGKEVPAYLRADRWQAAIGLAFETLAMSVLAIGLAATGALATAYFAAHTVAFGALADSRRTATRGIGVALYFLTRGLYAFTRAVPELVWALLVVFVLNPGILPGAVALGLHNLGILGKLGAEVIEDVDVRPLRSLRRSGARPAQVFLYGVLPGLLPQFLTYLLYRWEVVIRTTIVVGAVGAGGLGREFRLAMSLFHYTDVTLLLLVYLLLVFGVDALTAGLRRLAR